MSLVEFARSELEIAGLFKEDSDYGGMLGHAVLKMVEQFAGEGHSGFSAGMAISIFQKVARYEPLTPLTGADDEWNEVGPGLFQNRRCSRVFKENGKAYDIDGIIWRDPDGCTVTNRESRVPVTFPYVPKSEVRDRPAVSRSVAKGEIS